MLRGGRSTADKHPWRVSGALAVSGPPWVCPAHSVCAVPVYTAQVPGSSAGELSKVDHGLRALPRSNPLRFRFWGAPQRRRLGWPSFVLFPGPSSSGDQVLGACTLPRQVVRLSYHVPRPSRLASWACCETTVSGVPCVSSGELISDFDPPGRCQLSRIPGRLG